MARSHHRPSHRLPVSWGVVLLLLAFAVATSACGGATGGVGPEGSGRGLVLLSFEQDSIDNAPLNVILQFTFSEQLDPATITPASVQLREGPAFGRSVAGSFRVDGAQIVFEPALPGLCDLSDAGFKADTEYRIQLVGHPEEFAIRNTRGQPLEQTITLGFHTRIETDPDRFEDAVPGSAPHVDAATPVNGDQAIGVVLGNRIELTMSENLDPCSVNANTVKFDIYQFGNPATMVPAYGGTGNDSGFATVGGDTSDQTPGDPFTWGDGLTLPGISTPVQPLRIQSRIDLVQTFGSTKIYITPLFGRFPENALCVVQLTFGIEDFGGDPLVPFVMAFTTENLPMQTSTYVLENAGETPYDDGATTADVNTPRSPSKVQGYLLFSGDGDNGPDPLKPTLPQSDAPTCTADYQTNDGTPDDLDPTADVLLDTGSSKNQCANAADGSLAVVWEFKSIHIRNGVTVRVVGVNPAILLSQGDILIDNGGRLLVRGDNQGGSPRGDGEGNKNATVTTGCVGGVGVAGGGNGGECLGGTSAGSARYSGHGFQGYYHTNPTGPVAGDVGANGTGGAGHGNTSAYWSSQTTNNRNSPSGGGGGHSVPGGDGVANGSGSSPTLLDLPEDGKGGLTYGDNTSKLLTPEAGSGGGAGAEVRPFSGNAGRGPGGGGGAGGGFIDLTSGGNITVLGTVDAAGGRGGSNPGANFNPNYTFQPGTGGGGGGSGGGIRMLTPNDIVFGANTIVTAAGGTGGGGGATQGAPATPAVNNGGDGGHGRIALEDGNSVITGLATANVVPGEGSAGFYRGVFKTTRFRGGGLSPSATTMVFGVGPLNPTYKTPVQTYGGTEDFIAGVPVAGSPGAGKTAILVEVKGYDILPDGNPDVLGVITAPTMWHTVGYFTDSGIENLPTWHANQQPPLADIGSPPVGNNWAQPGIAKVNGREFLQVRITLWLSASASANDAGAFVDRWAIRFDHDQ